MSISPPVPLPAVPEGVQVTAWGIEPTDAYLRLGPREVMIVSLHECWQRCQYYGQLLKEQVEYARSRPGGPARGLFGHKTSVGSDGVYATGEEIRALARLEGQERDRLMRMAKECHDMGLTLENW